MTRTFCTPVDGSPLVAGGAHTQSTSSVLIRADEHVFQGHYPGFPIFPGACLVEYVHRSAVATAPRSLVPLELIAIDSARFLRPVWPGDEVQMDINGHGHGRYWRCAVVASTARGVAAQVKLCYRSRSAQ